MKQFSSFHSRHLPFIVRIATRNKMRLFIASSYQWHRQRLVVNPTFSAAKLKLMTALVNECIESFMDKLSEKCEEQADCNIYIIYKQLTMDVICNPSKNNSEMDDNDSDVMSKKLQYEEVISNVFLFMIAGYKTTSTALTYCTYILATHSTIQEKLRAEIDEQQDKYGSDYDRVHNMIYLDLFIREVLRMFPIAPKAVSRECNETTTVCGYVIEKGSAIQPDVLSLHYDPDLWGSDDPNLFVPERHLTRRHPMAYMPFGQGPCNCVGMRFAPMELKLSLTRLLHQYIILPEKQIQSSIIGNKFETKLSEIDTASNDGYQQPNADKLPSQRSIDANR
ncbi:unnamed protein product [Rotaria sp. Silwood1]|nr:unnamed protein product [Rotaria sp. Silwood1]CAF0971305.1 unnamed protein product [Rotaria sp. Silwood1]